MSDPPPELPIVTIRNYFFTGGGGAAPGKGVGAQQVAVAQLERALDPRRLQRGGSRCMMVTLWS